MPWKNIKTQFVKDRMAETSWKARKYIYDLAYLERFILKGGPKSFNEAVVYWNIRNQHSLELERITKEIKDGIYTSPEEFRKLEAKRRREEAIKAQQAEQETKAKEDANRRKWLELGGRP